MFSLTFQFSKRNTISHTIGQHLTLKIKELARINNKHFIWDSEGEKKGVTRIHLKC